MKERIENAFVGSSSDRRNFCSPALPCCRALCADARDGCVLGSGDGLFSVSDALVVGAAHYRGRKSIVRSALGARLRRAAPAPLRFGARGEETL